MRFLLLVIVVLPFARLFAGDPIAEGRAALQAGLPTVAIAKLSKAPASTDPARDRQIKNLLAQAHWQTGNSAEAAKLLESLPEPLTADETFLLAQCNFAQGNAEQAAVLFASVPTPEARAQRARALAASGKFSQALDLLATLPSTPRNALDTAAIRVLCKDYAGAIADLSAQTTLDGDDALERDVLWARALFGSGETEAALSKLPPLENLPSRLAAHATIIRTKVLLAQGHAGEAAALLENFVDIAPTHPDLREVFAALDYIHSTQAAPSTTALRRWTAQAQQPRAALAQYYLGLNEIRLKRLDLAAKAFNVFIETMPHDTLAEASRMRLCDILLDEGKYAETLDFLGASTAAWAQFYRGAALAKLERHDEAAQAFRAAAQETGWEAAKFNAALSDILAGKEPDLPESDRELLTLTRAFVLAAQRQPAATDALAAIANKSLQPWSNAAHLALAELARTDLDFPSARTRLLRISDPTPETAAQAEALAVFLQDDGTSDAAERLIEAAKKYLQNHTDAPQRIEVIMKLAEALFRRGDYMAARSYFDKVAEAHLGTPLAEKARFLSASAASRSMNSELIDLAIETYDSIARAGGDLAQHARLAQALIFNATDRPTQALAVLDMLIAAQPPASILYNAYIEKGDTLFSMGDTDPANIHAAITAWRLATAADTPPRWRNQAFTKIGAAYEKLGETEAAIAAYYDALNSIPTDEPEYFWRSKAGFDLARLLESLSRPAEARNIYERLVAIGGPRATEAREKLGK